MVAEVKRDLEKARSFERGRQRPLRRGPAPERRTAIRPRNEERQAEMKPQQFGVQAEVCRHLPCCCCFPEMYQDELLAMEHWTAQRISDPHHSPSVGAGGLDHNTSPVCRMHHDRIESPGWSEQRVQSEYKISFRRVAKLLHRNLKGNR